MYPNLNIQQKTYFGKEARKILVEGIQIVSKAVKHTLGASGKNAMFQSGQYAFTRSTKDGVTIAKSIIGQTPAKAAGINIMKEVASKAGEESGDGTTTCTVLAEAIIIKSLEAIDQGLHAVKIKKGIELATSEVLKQLKFQTKKIRTRKDLVRIATVSANGDAQIGNLMADVFKETDNHGLITIEENYHIKDIQYRKVNGLEFAKGHVNKHAFFTHPTKQTCELENPYILIYNGKFHDISLISGILEKCGVQEKRPILLLGTELGQMCEQSLIANVTQGRIRVCPVQFPDQKDGGFGIIQDISDFTGAKIFDLASGTTPQSATPQDLGTAKKVIVYANRTVIIGDDKPRSKVVDKCTFLENEIANCNDLEQIQIYKKRLAQLSGAGLTIIEVGGSTGLEVKEKADRVDDALNATRSAIKGGIVVGGGVALLRAKQKAEIKLSKTINDLKMIIENIANLENVSKKDKAVSKKSQAILKGIEILLNSITEPCKQIAYNVGMEEDELDSHLETILDSKNYFFGFDASKDKFTNLYKEGILDPANVVKIALELATSIATQVITTESFTASEGM